MALVISGMDEGSWESVRRIYQQGMDTNIATFETVCPSYEAFDASHTADCRYVIRADGDIVGWAALSPVSSRNVYRGVAEVSVYVDEAYRGKKAGTQLLSHLIQCSEQSGYWTLQAGIMQDNEASIHLHKKCGFRVIGYRERVAQDRFGTWRNTVLMERRSRVVGAEKESRSVAFICVHNSCRSQIAEALCRHFAGDVFDCYSAGTEVKDKINQDAVRLMKKLYGIDMEQTQRPKLLAELPPVDIVITMGCNVVCPALPAKHREDWGLEDPTGKSDAEFVRVIREIEQKVKTLKWSAHHNLSEQN